jgi:hypothetical protein
MLYVPAASTVNEIAPPMLKCASQPAACIGIQRRLEGNLYRPTDRLQVRIAAGERRPLHSHRPLDIR